MNSDKKLLKKIEKAEEKSLKLLDQQKRDLDKAIARNDAIIEAKLAKGTPAENKVEAEINKLRRKLDVLEAEMTAIRAKREERVAPYRRTDAELREQLHNVESQIESTLEIRERRRLGLQQMRGTVSMSAIPIPTAAPTTAMNSSVPVTPSTPPEKEPPSMTAPPPYSPYWGEE